MNIHEYQAKEILKGYGVKIQEGVVVDQLSDVLAAAEKLKAQTGTGWFVVKAQIHLLLDDSSLAGIDTFVKLPTKKSFHASHRMFELVVETDDIASLPRHADHFVIGHASAALPADRARPAARTSAVRCFTAVSSDG